MHAHDLLSPFALRSLWWPRAVTALAAGCSLWLLAQIVVLQLGGPTLPAPVLDPASLPAAATTAPSAGVRLSQWHLFGDGGQAPDLARLVAQAPETPLQLSLRGTLNVDADDGGIAIIADAQGQEQAYRIGDMLPGEARLTAIYAGRVLLSRGGIDEGLSLLPNAGGGSASAPPRNTANAAAVGGAAPGSSPGFGPAFVNPGMSFGAPAMDSLRAATPDIAELAKQVNVVPVMENNRFAGVRLSVGRDSDILSRTGLRTTDIITSVNGIPLDGPQRSAELMTALQGARQLNLTIRRDGQTQNLTVGL